MAWLDMKNIRNRLKRKKISKNMLMLWSTKKKILMLIPIMPSQAVLESDDVIEHEEYEKLFGTEEDIKEYINVMVYQEESIDVE